VSDFSAIRVSGLGKQYVLGGAERIDESFREMLSGALMSPFRRLRRLQGGAAADQRFWALQDVNFEIMPGEVVGIVGRNGAGKSTLLKILSRITDPSDGRIEIRGRVSSLLEVGTGFHPELTGRENIFLNGAILGMKRREILDKFDEIVAFAEVEKFLDTPVKRYSSGMYVRLAFAVAAHLEPEILVVDEVLAVGDAAFQKKCLGKMQDVGNEGRTVLFVSHNMGAVKNLCNRAIMLSQGTVLMDGHVEEVIEYYMGGDSPNVREYVAESESSDPFVRRLNISQQQTVSGGFRIDKPICLSFSIETHDQQDLEVGLRITNMQGICVHHSCSAFMENAYEKDFSELGCTIPPYALAPGKYAVDYGLGKRNYQLYDRKENALVFEVEFAGTLSDKTSATYWKGICGPGMLRWE